MSWLLVTFALLSMLYRNQDGRGFLFCFIVQNILWDSAIYGDKKKKYFDLSLSLGEADPALALASSTN